MEPFGLIFWCKIGIIVFATIMGCLAVQTIFEGPLTDEEDDENESKFEMLTYNDIMNPAIDHVLYDDYSEDEICYADEHLR
tara:strand:- start:1799 stop:2041 length:243 start_codon:yes stop_codon:yes gene_type:complete